MCGRNMRRRWLSEMRFLAQSRTDAKLWVNLRICDFARDQGMDQWKSVCYLNPIFPRR